MDIQIAYCNNIESGIIEVRENSLNIKYGINGTGKSTLSKAICASVSDRIKQTSELSALRPFKYRDSDSGTPSVSGADGVRTVMVFDERYINEFVFQADELLKGSFDIFIRDERYEAGLQSIDDLVISMRHVLTEDKDVSDLISDFHELSGSFGKPVRKGIHSASPVAKAFKGGNKVIHIPEGLEDYADHIRSNESHKWLKWQLEGNGYIDISANCPYCTNDIHEKKSTISRVGEIYDPKSIENLNKLVAVFQRLDRYFSDDTRAVIDSFVKCIDGYSDDQINYLTEVREQVDRFKTKLVEAQALSFASLKDVDGLVEALKGHSINLDLFVHLNSSSTAEKVAIVNRSVEELLTKASELQGHINKQKRLIETLVQEHSGEINGFLRNAGYRYEVQLVEGDDGQHKLKLRHCDGAIEVSNARNHLSFGERNAFALVLFMYDALKRQPDLIVLDDPISSFDKNKKYAIIDMLFRRSRSFRDRTVLLLTHDFDPIVDMVCHHRDRFPKPFASFLLNQNGVLSEIEIGRDDVRTFIDISKSNIALEIHPINKLVYLRRLHEVTKSKGAAYQVISSLLHKADIPYWLEEGSRLRRPMSCEEVSSGTTEIQEHISDFDYPSLLSLLKDDVKMRQLYFASTNNYEKLHLYRIVFDDIPEAIKSDVIRKFINEAFHIENNYIYQLDPCRYPLVPQYVIAECDELMANAGQTA